LVFFCTVVCDPVLAGALVPALDPLEELAAVDRGAVAVLRGAERVVVRPAAAAEAAAPRSTAEMLSRERAELACDARFKSCCSASFALGLSFLQPAATVTAAANITISVLLILPLR
jgi:hypothetical protein